MTFELTILGSNSALPTSSRFPTAQVLRVHERFFLIDCGEGTQLQLRKFKVKMGKINHVLISHLHGDHLFGLFGLLSTFNLLGRKVPLTIIAPKGINRIIDFFKADLSEEMNYEIKVVELNERVVHDVYDDKVLRIKAFPLKHRVPTFGYLVSEKYPSRNIKKEAIKEYDLSIPEINQLKKGEDVNRESGEILSFENLTYYPYKPRSYAYCSDTAYYEKNISLLRNTDLIYHEATFLEKDKSMAKKTGHSTAKQAAKFAKESNAGKLLMGHYSSRYTDVEVFESEAREVFKESYTVNDGDLFTIPLNHIKLK